jgi:quinol monooxygenase YgiN
MPELLVIARLNAAAGEEEAVSTAVPKLIVASRAEPGVLSFSGYRSLDDPTQIVLLELYSSRAAFDAHLAAPHYQDIALNNIVPRLESRTIEQFDVTARRTE